MFLCGNSHDVYFMNILWESIEISNTTSKRLNSVIYFAQINVALGVSCVTASIDNLNSPLDKTLFE